MKQSDVDLFFRRLQAQNPTPKTELSYTNPYTLLVAVVMSAQMTDAGVNKATAALFKVADSPEKMLQLGEARLDEMISSVGLHRGKSKNIIGLSNILIQSHGGKLPRTRVELEALPGVGRKTANVVLNVVYGEPTMAVDTHVFRVSNRTGMARGDKPEQVETGLLKVIPVKYMHSAHHWLILHGRYTCKARIPLCPDCPVRDLCAYPDKTAPSPGLGLRGTSNPGL